MSAGVDGKLLTEGLGGRTNGGTPQRQVAQRYGVLAGGYPNVSEEPSESWIFLSLAFNSIYKCLAVLLNEIFEWSGAQHAECGLARADRLSCQNKFPKSLGIFQQFVHSKDWSPLRFAPLAFARTRAAEGAPRGRFVHDGG